MTPLTVFGLFAVTAMLVFYALEDRKPVFILAFAGACVLGSIYAAAGGEGTEGSPIGPADRRDCRATPAEGSRGSP